MTFSYDPALSSTKDTFRFRLGDTNPAALENERLEDEEIEATIAAQSVAEALAQCAEALAAKFFRHATTKQLASAKVSYEKRVDNLLAFADRLRSGIESIAATDIVITGTTKTELDDSAGDSDLVQPAFFRGQFANPDATAAREDAE